MWTNEAAVDSLRQAKSGATALTGTVPIPSPVPAVGMVLIGRTPAAAPSKIGYPPSDYYARVVQNPGPRVVLSRYFDAGPVGGTGAIRALKGVLYDEKTQATAAPKFLIASELLAKLDKLKGTITKDGVDGEQVLARDAVVHVPESTPVQVRHDMMTTADEPFADVFCSGCPIPGC